MSQKKQKQTIESPWHPPLSELLEKLDASPSEGLSESTVRNRLKIHGKNQLREIKRRSAFKVFVDQVTNLIMLLLLVAALLSFYLGDWIEGLSIVAVMLLTALIGFFTEIRAVRAMESLREMSRVDATVLRAGESRSIPAVNLVPGDIILFEGGDIITADLRLIEANKLQANESAMTGESVPVKKEVTELEPDTQLTDRRNMLFKGTAVTNGSGMGVAVATGMDTELGKISDLVASAEEEITPLEKRLEHLGRKLIWLTIGIAAVVAALGVIRGKDVYLMIKTSIALAVAAIPEGLPIVATVALARGMIRMSRRNVLVNRLSSVETLGATNVIFSDKTGTLTENRMTVTRLLLGKGEVRVGSPDEDDGIFQLEGEETEALSDPLIERALKTGVLCNNASLSKNEGEESQDGVGDPLEIALLAAGVKAGMHRDELLQEWPEEREEAFDAETKMMATFHRRNGDLFVAVKGAPEAVIERASSFRKNGDTTGFDRKEKERWLELNDELAKDGLRVLALAERTASDKDEDPYEDLTFLGLVGLLDPPRPEIVRSIDLCKQAGIRVIMVTGDQSETARYVAREINLVEDQDARVIVGSKLKKNEDLSEEEKKEILSASIFARVSPAQKLDLISVHQENKSIVAMTGDGVNDAPALKKADIGVAMGKRGTQVAQEASDMVLKDDAFSSIVTAVEYGRVIFNNIRKFILFLLSGNVGEVLAVGFASLMGLPLPLLPLQILFINLVMDVFPALALGVGAAHEDVMKNPPRHSEEPIVAAFHWKMIGFYGLVIAVCVVIALVMAQEYLMLEEGAAVSISFLTLALARLWHVFNMRDAASPVFRNEVTRNPVVWGAIGLCFILVMMTVYVPVIADILKVENPGSAGWLLIVIMSIVPLLIGQAALGFLRMKEKKQ